MGYLHHTQDFHHLHKAIHIPTYYIFYPSYILAQEHVTSTTRGECLPPVQATYEFLRIGPEILIEISLVLIAVSNENPFHHVLVCSFVI